MKYLLDVNVLLAAIWDNHIQHKAAFDWLEDKEILLCPLSELGFLRVSTNPKAINAPMEKSRDLLKKFVGERRAKWIPDDLPALQSHAQKSSQVTDIYFAELAARHGARLASFDLGIKHPSVDFIQG